MTKNDSKKIPEAVQDLLGSSEILEKIRMISAKHNLHVDQGAVLEEVIDNIILGITDIKNSKEAIEKSLEVSSNQAIEIVTDLNREIFNPIRNSLKEVANPKNVVSDIDEEKERVEMMNMIENPEASMTKMKEVGGEKEEKPSVNHELPPSPPVFVPEKEEAPDNLPIAPTESEGSKQEREVSIQEEVMEPEIHEKKLGTISKTPKVESVIGKKIAVNLIPEDVKNKINNDPYRESIE